MIMKLTGFIVVIAALLIGYWLQGGDLMLFFQPVELLIILGLSIGSFMLGNPTEISREVARRIKGVFQSNFYGQGMYKESLVLVAALFDIRSRFGDKALESVLDDPTHRFYASFPMLESDERVLDFTRSSVLSSMLLADSKAQNLIETIEAEVNIYTTFQNHVARSLNDLSEAMPAFGIIAAITGVILAMTMLNESPEVIGYGISAALVGTLTGIFLGYGLVKPMASSFEHFAYEQRVLMELIQKAVLMGDSGVAPNTIIETLSNSLPQHVRLKRSEVSELVNTLQAVRYG